MDNTTQAALEQEISNLDAFTLGYIEAMLWTECTLDSEPDMEEGNIDDLSPEALAIIKADCERFQAENAALLRRAFYKSHTAYKVDIAGHDFWFTRNSHGVGFWDRGLGEIGDKLTESAKRFKGTYLYRGNNGKLYLA